MVIANIKAQLGSLDDWLKRFFEGQKGIDKAIWQGTYEELSKAINLGTSLNIAKLDYDSPDFKLITQLQNNAAVFAAFKNHDEQNQLVSLLKDENGKPRTWHEFKKLAEPITDKYNKRWLETEYNQSIASAQMAKKWIGFEANADLYPNLEYRAVNDKRSRPEHARLDGTILPITHKFWNKHYPPNGWGCRCSVTQTDKEPTKEPDTDKPDKGFDFNPGKDKKLFSDSAGYYDTPDKDTVNDMARTLTANYSRAQTRKVLKGKALKGKLDGKSFQLSKSDVKAITGKKHKNEALRNSLLADISNVINNAEFIKTVEEVKGRSMYTKWHYYKVKGYEDMFLNIAETPSGELKLHAITDKIK